MGNSDSRPRALWLAALLGCAVFGVAGDVWAQRVYKSVGPDGKVTFTDRPPAGQEPAAAQGAAAPAAPAAPSAPSAPGAVAAPAAAPAAAQLEPALEKAILVLAGFESIVNEYADLCVKTLPTSFKKYQGAADDWRQRHVTLLARQNAVMRDHLSPAQRASMRSAVQFKTRGMMAPVHAANTAQRIKWCDDNTLEVSGGKVDLAGNHVAALMAYQGKR